MGSRSFCNRDEEASDESPQTVSRLQQAETDTATSSSDATQPMSPERAESAFGVSIPNKKSLFQLQRKKANHPRHFSGWVDEGMTSETMGNPNAIEAFRQRQADRPPEVPTDIERRNKRSVQRSTDAAAETGPAGQTGVPDSVRDVISSTGHSLDGTVQRMMEDRMDSSFDDVQIHTGAKAANACESINARAFTVGNHVAFNQGEYEPDSPAGQHVIAHELAHVRQQTDGAVSMLSQEEPELEVDPDPALEREAEQTAQQVMQGGELGIQRLDDSAVHIQRIPKDKLFELLAVYESEGEEGDQNDERTRYRREQNSIEKEFILSDIVPKVRDQNQSKRSFDEAKRTYDTIVNESAILNDYGGVHYRRLTNNDMEQFGNAQRDMVSEDRIIKDLENNINKNLEQIGVTEQQREKIAGLDFGEFAKETGSSIFHQGIGQLIQNSGYEQISNYVYDQAVSQSTQVPEYHPYNQLQRGRDRLANQYIGTSKSPGGHADTIFNIMSVINIDDRNESVGLHQKNVNNLKKNFIVDKMIPPLREKTNEESEASRLDREVNLPTRITADNVMIPDIKNLSPDQQAQLDTLSSKHHNIERLNEQLDSYMREISLTDSQRKHIGKPFFTQANALETAKTGAKQVASAKLGPLPGVLIDMIHSGGSQLWKHWQNANIRKRGIELRDELLQEQLLRGQDRQRPHHE